MKKTHIRTSQFLSPGSRLCQESACLLPSLPRDTIFGIIAGLPPPRNVSCGVGDTTAPVDAVDTFVLEYIPRSPDDNSDTEDIGGEGSSAKPGTTLCWGGLGKLGEGSSGHVVEGELVSMVVVSAGIGWVRLKRAKKPTRPAFC